MTITAYKSISEFADVITGGTPSTSITEYWGGNIPWLNSGVLNDGDIKTPSKYITELGLKNSSAQIMPKDSVLIALTGATTGQVGYLTFEACANQSVTGILPSKQHHPRYLYYFLKTQRQKIVGDAFGGGQPHINQKYIKDFIVPLPPLDDQIRIAHLLSKVECLIAQRKQHLQHLGRLIKSVFLEMFGDPERNEKGWGCENLGKLTLEKIGYGIVQPGKPVESGVPVIRVGDFIGTRISSSNITNVAEEISRKHKNSVLKGDEILLACVGATIGKVALVDKLHKGHNIVRATARIRPSEKVHRLYLAYYLLSDFSKRYFVKVTRSVGQPTLNINQIEELPTIVPPIDLQNRFATIVEKIEGVRSLYQQSLTEFENLYGMLGQKAFKGELDLSRIDLTKEAVEQAKTVTPVFIEEKSKPAIELLAPTDLSNLTTADVRMKVFDQWLDSYLQQLGGGTFSTALFMEIAQQRLWELLENDAYQLSVAEYDHVKQWLFNELDKGRISQQLNIISKPGEELIYGNQIVLKKAT